MQDEHARLLACSFASSRSIGRDLGRTAWPIRLRSSYAVKLAEVTNRQGFEVTVGLLHLCAFVAEDQLLDGDLETELRSVLAHRHDTPRLAASPLGDLIAGAPDAPVSERAERLRRTIRERLDAARANASADQLLAHRALELAYCDRAGSFERCVERLSVSRSTFYRLLRRGTETLATTFVAR